MRVSRCFLVVSIPAEIAGRKGSTAAKRANIKATFDRVDFHLSLDAMLQTDGLASADIRSRSIDVGPHTPARGVGGIPGGSKVWLTDNRLPVTLRWVNN